MTLPEAVTPAPADVAEFVSFLRARGIDLALRDGGLVVRPKSALRPGEEERIVADVKAIVAALRAPQREDPDRDALVVDAKAEIDAEVAAAVEREQAVADRYLASRLRPRKVLLFKTLLGRYLPVEDLSAADVENLRRRGVMGDDDVRTWLRRSSRRAW